MTNQLNRRLEALEIVEGRKAAVITVTEGITEDQARKQFCAEHGLIPADVGCWLIIEE